MLASTQWATMVSNSAGIWTGPGKTQGMAAMKTNSERASQAVMTVIAFRRRMLWTRKIAGICVA